ncbi:MAG: flagellar export chaperone FlgN [Pseudomonadota bacterium]
MNRAPAITRQQALARLLGGVADDVDAYRALLLLLEQQFDAALRHHSARLGELAAHIGAALEPIEARRQQRVSLVTALLGAHAKMADVCALLKGDTRARLEQHWLELEQLIAECKRRNVRTSQLLTTQYSIMQRVLHGEDQIYAPA